MHRSLSLTKGKAPGGKQWIHPQENLSKNSVAYTVKFLGHVEVDQPKGSDMVREAIRKMKFSKQIKKAEGQRSTKVEMVISMDAITIQDPKNKVVLFQCPLYLVSYCADDKSDKRMFTFIAKDKVTDKHKCFVFDSERSAEDITMTVGQAFDLAYRNFLDNSNSSNGDADTKKQLLVCQKKVQELTNENRTLKKRVAALENLLESSKQSTDIVPSAVRSPATTNGHVTRSFSSSSVPPALSPPPIPVRQSSSATPPVHSSPPQEVDLFGAPPFSPLSPSIPNPFSPPPALTPLTGSDNQSPFAYQTQPSNSSSAFGSKVSYNERELLDMQANFSRGLSFGTEDFSLDDFDPIKN